MAISSVTSAATQVETLVRQLANTVDSNKDGQVSVMEFGAFIRSMMDGSTSLATTASATSATGTSATGAAPSVGIVPMFRGFDASRAESAVGSLKYDAYNVLKNYDPRDTTAMRGAFTALSAAHPGKYELDTQDNLLLTGTSDGYIGARPVNRDSDWSNRAQDWSWDWFSYNAAHPGPNGEVA
jgi:hypothetical protein